VGGNLFRKIDEGKRYAQRMDRRTVGESHADLWYCEAVGQEQMTDQIIVA
jgi:hypothetical protein